MSVILGGYGETMEATEETQQMCDQVRPEVEKKTDEVHDEFIAIEYRLQTVSGQNFLIKVCAGGTRYIHLKVFRPLYSDMVELTDYQLNKNREDHLEPL